LLALIEDALQDDRGILAVVYRTASFPAGELAGSGAVFGKLACKAERLARRPEQITRTGGT